MSTCLLYAVLATAPYYAPAVAKISSSAMRAAVRCVAAAYRAMLMCTASLYAAPEAAKAYSASNCARLVLWCYQLLRC
jgi:hypothetical protein